MSAMRALPLGLGTAWAVWWTFFAVASSAGNWIAGRELFSPFPVVIVLALLVSITLAWRWSMIGGALLSAIGLLLLWASLYFFNNPASTTWFLVLTLSLPPLISGLLLLADAWPARSRRP
jgi:hypothetical protein